MYSLPAHKEFRFLLPALLLLMPYCGVGLNDLAGRWGQQSATADTLLHQVHIHDYLMIDYRNDRFVSAYTWYMEAVERWSASTDSSGPVLCKETVGYC